MFAAAYSLLVLLLPGSLSALDVGSPEQYLAHVFDAFDAGRVAYDPETEEFNSNSLRARNAISSMRKKAGSTDIIDLDPFGTAEGGLGNLFADSTTGPRRSLRAPIGATRELAKSGKYKAKNQKTKTGKTKTEKTKAGENTVELEEEIKDLHEQLGQCRHEREEAESPDWLFVQMSLQCGFFRQGNDHYVKMFQAAKTTYQFTDRPERLARHFPTWLFAEKYDNIFQGSEGFPNGAITFSSAQGIQAPIIGVFAGAPFWSYDNDGNLELTYKLKQEREQREIFDVANITESERFNSCSFFLDGSHAHDPVANPRGGDDDVVKVFNDLKQGLGVTTGGIEKIAEGGYGLLKKAFSDEEEAPPKKDRAKMITDTLQNAIGAISDVVKVVQADGSMSYSQLAETAGEMLTSIGAMLGPVAGPVGPVLVVVGMLTSLIASFFGSAPSGGEAYTLNLDTLATVVKRELNDNDMRMALDKVVTSQGNAGREVKALISDPIASIGHDKFGQNQTYALLDGIPWDLLDEMISAMSTAYTVVYESVQGSALARITSYLNNQCGDINEAEYGKYTDTCKWNDDQKLINGKPAVASKNFLYSGAYNFKRCKESLKALGDPFNVLPLLAKLYQYTNYVVSQLNMVTHILCTNLPEDCSCPNITFANNNELISWDALGSDTEKCVSTLLSSSPLSQGVVENFFTKFTAFQTPLQRAFDLSQSFLQGQAIEGRPSFGEQCNQSPNYPHYWPTHQHCDKDSCNNAYIFVVSSDTYENRWHDKDKTSAYGTYTDVPTDGGAMQLAYGYSVEQCKENCATISKKLGDAGGRQTYTYQADDDVDPSDTRDTHLSKAADRSCDEDPCITCRPIGQDLPDKCYKAQPCCDTYPSGFRPGNCQYGCSDHTFGLDWISIVALPTFCPESDSCAKFLTNYMEKMTT